MYNIGSGVARSFLEVTEILQSELKTNLSIEYFPNPYKNYQLDTQADISSSKKYLDYMPEFSLEDGIKSYIEEIISFHDIDIS